MSGEALEIPEEVARFYNRVRGRTDAEFDMDKIIAERAETMSGDRTTQQRMDDDAGFVIGEPREPIKGMRAPADPVIVEIDVKVFALPCCGVGVQLRQDVDEWRGVKCPSCGKSYTIDKG